MDADVLQVLAMVGTIAAGCILLSPIVLWLLTPPDAKADS
jgi:hypothetical protein